MDASTQVGGSVRREGWGNTKATNVQTLIVITGFSLIFGVTGT